MEPRTADLDRQLMACKRCRVVLNRYTHPDGSIEWVHARRPWEDDDHDPEPVPAASVGGGAMVCDFCSSPDATWYYFGQQVTARVPGNFDNAYSGRWASCDTCDRYLKRGDLDGLMEVVKSQPAFQHHFADAGDGVNEKAMAYWKHMWATYLSTVYKRERIPPPPPPPAELRPVRLPKIRDRLVRYWEEPVARRAIARGAADESLGLPGVDCGVEGRFAVTSFAHTPESIDAYCRRIAVGLAVADLYWVSNEFTRLAVAAAKQLPDLTITREEMPSANGMVVWQQPVMEVPTAKGPALEVVAACWTLVPDGVWVTLYCQPEQAIPDTDREVLREAMGYLMPVGSGGGAPFGIHPMGDGLGSQRFSVLLSTWFLMAQPGVAETVKQPAEKQIRRAYARAGRGDPHIHVVDLRRRAAAERAQSDQPAAQRTYRVRWMVRGFWRDQPYGPQRSLRKRIYISPYLKGPDGAPLKGDEDTVVVKALR